jgi:hypothetical protein
MKKIILISLTAVALVCSASAQNQAIREKLQDFFFAIPFGSDTEVLKLQLSQDPEFKLYEDPNRDAKKTIVGTLTKDKNLNPVATGNQLIILYLPGGSKKKKNVSIKWSINYKLEDLPIALSDFEKIKSDFKPYFTDITEKLEVGEHKEEILSMILKSKPLSLTIRVIKYNNFIHTVSLEYRDLWKIEPVEILKVKY